MSSPAESARDEQRRVVEKVLPLIHRIVNELCARAPAELRAEAVQEACARAAVAATRYDRERFDTRFTSYVAPFITGAVHDVLFAERKQRSEAASFSLGAREQLAETTDRFEVIWDPLEVNRARLLLAARHIVAAQWAGFGSAASNEELLVGAETRARARKLLQAALADLGPDERFVYDGHYVRGETFVAMAAERGVATRTLRRHHDALLDRLGDLFRREGIDENPGALEP
jgi:RNA polymerase sigma factor (sigma-70 family)